jgi:NADH-quinone oxidoreductase subunit L
MLGAFGKSAQFPLHVWLPDAMEGPTPVSALIHAATMVTAGVYMIARLGVLFVQNESAMLTVAVVGALTAVLGATIALRQFDLKKVFAYSTVSQLGFMFVALGVLAPVAAVFHLVTHAFFKALLFLSSGVVMHATGGELDLRRMSGLKRLLPVTRILCLVGCLALAGFPIFTAGFWSKDEILVGALNVSWVLYLVMTITAFITSYYTFRLYFRVFEGPELLPHHASVAESQAGHSAAGHHHHGSHEPLILVAPLVVLAVGALLVGWINLPFGLGIKAHALGTFLGESPSLRLAHAQALEHLALDEPLSQVIAPQFGQKTQQADYHIHWTPIILSGLVSIAGIVTACWLHLVDRPLGERLPLRVAGLTRVFERKYWLDELYNRVLVAPARALAYIFDVVDKYVIDGLVTLISLLPQSVGAVLKFFMQRGYVQGYALTALAGLGIILVVIVL